MSNNCRLTLVPATNIENSVQPNDCNAFASLAVRAFLAFLR